MPKPTQLRRALQRLTTALGSLVDVYENDGGPKDLDQLIKAKEAVRESEWDLEQAIIRAEFDLGLRVARGTREYDSPPLEEE